MGLLIFLAGSKEKSMSSSPKWLVISSEAWNGNFVYKSIVMKPRKKCEIEDVS